MKEERENERGRKQRDNISLIQISKGEGREIEGKKLKGRSLLHFVPNKSFQHGKNLGGKFNKLSFIFFPSPSLTFLSLPSFLKQISHKECMQCLQITSDWNNLFLNEITVLMRFQLCYISYISLMFRLMFDFPSLLENKQLPASFTRMLEIQISEQGNILVAYFSILRVYQVQNFAIFWD